MSGDIIIISYRPGQSSHPLIYCYLSTSRCKYNNTKKAQRHCSLVPLYTSDLQERRANKLRILRQRGKGPPKKGAGKRSK